MTAFVGVVGHRPHRLPDADVVGLGSALREVLALVRSRAAVRRQAASHAGSRPLDLVAISPLAEGADQVFAGQALDLGFGLLCPMPFPQPEYESDYVGRRAESPDALQRFRALLDRARASNRLTVIELPGNRQHEAEGYAEAGRLVVERAHLLVAVWDGEWSGHVGGTDDALRMARERGLPVIWVRAQAPHRWSAMPGTEPAESVGVATANHTGDAADDRRGVEAAIDRALADALEGAAKSGRQ